MTRLERSLVLGVLFLPILGATTALADPGACCIPPSGQCFILTQQQCDGLNAYWEGPDTACGPNP